MLSNPKRVSLTFPDGTSHEQDVGGAGLTLGRAPSCDVVLNDPTVSRSHARIEQDGDDLVIVDVGSTRGTQVNGATVQRATLRSGDAVSLGDTTFVFRIVPQGAAAQAQDHFAAAGATMFEELLPDVRLGPTVASVVVRTAERTWEVPLGWEAVTIGRIPESTICLAEPGVSRRHASIERQGNLFVIRDLHSTNGTWIGLRRIEEHALDDGDTVRIGSTRLVFKRNLSPGELSVFEGVVPPTAPPAMEIEIDAAKCRQQVDDIAGSDFFRGLMEKSRRMRRK